MRTLINTYAPAGYVGLRGDTPDFQLTEFAYVYNVTLTANQSLQDNKSIDPDADFIIEAISIPLATGAFTFRYSDSRLYWTSDSQIASVVYTSVDPYPVAPPLVIPAGGRIGIDLTDTSANTNTIQIVFRGAKRYQAR